jgi:pimeloyl-ACP methyl ester carboxylesterase
MPMTDTWFYILIAVALLIAANIAFAWWANRRHPPVGHFIEVDGVRLHTIERGDKAAPVLVVLHGNGALIEDMLISGLIDRASENFRVICFDRPGFGHSSRPRLRLWTPERQAELIEKALARMGVTEAVTLGHSWGTLVALALALRPDSPTRGLVLVSGYYFPSWRTDAWLLSGPAIPVIGDLMRYTVSPLLSALILPLLFKIIFAPKPPLPASRYPAALMVRPLHLRAAAEESVFMIPAAARLAPSYPNITCPVTIIAGDGDRVVTPTQAARLAALIPRAKLVMLPGIGHMVHHFAADEIVREAVAIDLRASA